MWTSWRSEEVSGNTAPTQRFRCQLYRFGMHCRGQILAKWAPAHVAGDCLQMFIGLDLFARRTRFLPDEKTRLSTRLSGQLRTGLTELVTGCRSRKQDLPTKNQAGAAGRNRTCDPLLRREMLYPLSYSRAARQCIKAEDTRCACAPRGPRLAGAGAVAQVSGM
jgi:hypothetical protein